MTETIEKLSELSPFFEKINRFDEPKSKQSSEDEMVGKSSNRTLDKKWDVKIQMAADFFTKTFSFITSMGYDVVFGLSEKTVKIHKIDPGNVCLTYVVIDKTEMSEYVNNNFAIPNIIQDSQIVQTTEQIEPPEQIVYVEFDMLDGVTINNKYPVDIYFDTKDRQRMYIVNSKVIESRRLNDIGNNSTSVMSYKSNYNKLFTFIKHINTVSTTFSHTSLSNTLSILDKKKTKKDKKSSGFLKIKFGTSETDFLIGDENEPQSSSIQMYGDDIALRPLRESNIMLQLDYLVRFKHLELSNNVTFHLNEDFPLIIETRFGAGKIRLFYVISPRVEAE